MPQPLFPKERAYSTHFNRRLGGPETQSGNFLEDKINLLPLAGFELQIIQPVT
jgi:hypothetical protein